MSLKAFLSENAKKKESKEVIISDRFVNSKGEKEPFILEPVSAATDEAIRKDCHKQGIDKNGKPYVKFDSTKYQRRLVIATVKEPDLHSKELQDSYGVMGADKLLMEMLYSGEYTELSKHVQEVNGFKTFQEEEEEAKNE